MELKKQGTEFVVSAKELYTALGVKRKYAQWVKESIARGGLEDGKDFFSIMLQSTGGRPSVDYWLKRDAAITIVVMSGGRFAKELRKKVIELYNQHDTGLAFTAPQVEALMDLSKAMTLVSIQKEVEVQHFNLYNDKYTWYEHRAALLGYKTNDIVEAMKKVGKKHHSTRASLLRLDANELIRIGIIDLFKALGKTDEYSTNVGNLCKSLAEKAEYGNIIWDDTKPNPLKLNTKEVKERKTLFGTRQKHLI